MKFVATPVLIKLEQKHFVLSDQFHYKLIFFYCYFRFHCPSVHAPQMPKVNSSHIEGILGFEKLYKILDDHNLKLKIYSKDNQYSWLLYQNSNRQRTLGDGDANNRLRQGRRWGCWLYELLRTLGIWQEVYYILVVYVS